MAANGLLSNRVSLKNNKSVINPLVTNYLCPRETKLQNSKKAKIHGIRQVAQCGLYRNPACKTACKTGSGIESDKRESPYILSVNC